MVDARQALTEVEKMARVPGIWFKDTPSGRTAMVEGTGLGVWQIMKLYEPPTYDRAWLRSYFHWLAGWQMDAAFHYYDLFRDEVQRRLDYDRRLEEVLMTKQSWTSQEIADVFSTIGPFSAQ